MFHIPIRYFLRLVASALFISMTFSAHSQPQTDIKNPGFTLVGFIEDLKIQSVANTLSAGTMTVNGINVTLPANLLITMPGQYLTLHDIFQGKTPTGAATVSKSVSGIALKDAPPNTPRLPVEATIIGNVVSGNYVAGVVRLAQLGLHMGAGVIDSIDHVKGAMFVRSSVGGSLTRVILNDPGGVYGLKNSEKTFAGYPAGTHPMDERFASDPDNAPFRAETGYPLCLPTSAAGDANCPNTNRKNGTATLSRFTCGSTPADPTSPALATCDPSKKAPLMEGDYITYSGMLTEESTNTFFISAHGIAAMLGIYTSPGAPEAWVTIEEVRLGTSGYQDVTIPQEETPRIKLVGFTTDPSRDVTLSAIDIDPTTGAKTERFIMTVTPQRIGQVGRLRRELRPPKTAVSQVPRDIVIRRVDAFPQLAKGPRVFTAPVTEYIYPENTLFGSPNRPVSVPFEYFCFLKRGAGPLDTLGRTAATPVIGPLFPFPGGSQPSAVNPANPTLNIAAVCP
jgi:hypothetical protein